MKILPVFAIVIISLVFTSGCVFINFICAKAYANEKCPPQTAVNAKTPAFNIDAKTQSELADFRKQIEPFTANLPSADVESSAEQNAEFLKLLWDYATYNHIPKPIKPLPIKNIEVRPNSLVVDAETFFIEIRSWYGFMCERATIQMTIRSGDFRYKDIALQLWYEVENDKICAMQIDYKGLNAENFYTSSQEKAAVNRFAFSVIQKLAANYKNSLASSVKEYLETIKLADALEKRTEKKLRDLETANTEARTKVENEFKKELGKLLNMRKLQGD